MNVRSIIDFVVDEHAKTKIFDVCYYQTVCRMRLEGHFNLLAALANDATGNIVEIGTNIGLGTMILAYGARLRPPEEYEPVISLDIVEEKTVFSNELAKKLDMGNVFCHVGTSHDLPKYIKKGALGFAYIDGDHSFQGCLEDLENTASLLGIYGKLLLHDFPIPLDGWEDRGKEHGVAHACYCFLKNHPEFSMIYLGNGLVIMGKYANNRWDFDRAMKSLE